MQIALIIYLTISIVMGFFSVTQLGYQRRTGGLKMFLRSIWSFAQGFVAWPVLFPMGMMKGKYKMNVAHKVGDTNVH